MKQANLAQTAVLKFINNKDLNSKRTSFTKGKWSKYSLALKKWVDGNPKWIQLDDGAFMQYKDTAVFVNWTGKTITISKCPIVSEAYIAPRTMEYCVDAPTTYGDATMRHS